MCSDDTAAYLNYRISHPGVYPAMVRPIYPPQPVGIVGINPTLVRGPIIPPIIRPGGIPSVKPAEKRQTTIYEGKIASTVELAKVNQLILTYCYQAK